MKSGLIILGTVVVTVFLLLCCILTFALFGVGGYFATRPQVPTYVEPTMAPTQTPYTVRETAVPLPTAVPPTAAPTAMPTQVIAPTEVPTNTVAECNTIQISTDGGKTWNNVGEDLDTVLGKRVTWTSRRTVVPSKAWNEKLTAEELKLVETTTLRARINACENNKAVVFTGGIKIGLLSFQKGALFMFSGPREFEIRNGEIVIWLNDESHMKTDVSERIVRELRTGNFDIKSKLALAVTDNLKDYLPEDIMKGVQIVLIP